jgi:hypothetical protein
MAYALQSVQARATRFTPAIRNSQAQNISRRKIHTCSTARMDISDYPQGYAS